MGVIDSFEVKGNGDVLFEGLLLFSQVVMELLDDGRVGMGQGFGEQGMDFLVIQVRGDDEQLFMEGDDVVEKREVFHSNTIPVTSITKKARR